MEETKIMSPQIKGVIISLVVIVIGIAGYFTNLAFTSWYNWIANCFLMIAVIFACIQYANQKQGQVTFGNVFYHGFLITLVATIILLVYALLAFTVLFPDMKEKIFEMQRKVMEEKGFDDDKIETAMNMIKRYFMVGLVFGIIIGNLIWGCIASLIGAAVAKKNKMNPIDQLPG